MGFKTMSALTTDKSKPKPLIREGVYSTELHATSPENKNNQKIAEKLRVTTASMD